MERWSLASMRRWRGAGGRKIAAKGVYRDPPRSTRERFVKTSGPRLICVVLLAEVPWASLEFGPCRLCRRWPTLNATQESRASGTRNRPSGPGSCFSREPLLRCWPCSLRSRCSLISKLPRARKQEVPRARKQEDERPGIARAIRPSLTRWRWCVRSCGLRRRLSAGHCGRPTH